jgi:hypothetical protein
MEILVVHLITILIVLRIAGIRDTGYIGMAVMAILSTRPNILGEYVGMISPIFWLGLIILIKLRNSRRNKPSEIDFDGSVVIFGAFCIYWTLSFIASQYNSSVFYYWPAIANLGTLTFVLISVSYVSANEGLEKFLLIFAFVNSYIGLSGLISKYVFMGYGCESIYLGRVWEYSICAPGAVFIGDRLTGIGGEPGIFASYCILSISIFLMASLNRFMKTLGIFGCVTGVVLTTSSIGYALLPISVVLFTFFLKGSILKKTLRGYFLLTFVLVFYAALIGFVNDIFINKKSSNAFSVTDRGLDIPISEYFESWGKGIFHNGSYFNSKFSTISILRESLSQGVWVILLFLLILSFLSFLSQSSLTYLVAVLPISVTVFVSQPFWSNAFWITLLLCFALQVKRYKSLDSHKIYDS